MKINPFESPSNEGYEREPPRKGNWPDRRITVFELLLVIVIIGIIIGLMMPAVQT